jgi:hypothetical protein
MLRCDDGYIFVNVLEELIASILRMKQLKECELLALKLRNNALPKQP